MCCEYGKTTKRPINIDKLPKPTSDLKLLSGRGFTLQTRWLLLSYHQSNRNRHYLHERGWSRHYNKSKRLSSCLHKHRLSKLLHTKKHHSCATNLLSLKNAVTGTARGHCPPQADSANLVIILFLTYCL